MTPSWSRCLSLFAALCLGAAGGSLAGGDYSIVDLGDFGGNYSQARAINLAGQVVGEGLLPVAGTVQHAFSWQSGLLSDLGTLGGQNSRAVAINNAGTVGGWAQDASGATQAALWNGASVTALPTLGGNSGAAWGLNDAGAAVGQSSLSSGVYHAVLWNGAGVHDLGTLGGSYSVAYDINNHGIVVGEADNSAGGERACLWGASGAVDLGSLSGGLWNAAAKINDSGAVILWGTPAGASASHAAFWNGISGSPVVDLGTFGGSVSWAYGLNDQGSVVGWAQEPDGTYHAFVWNGTVKTDLGTLGGFYSSAYGINDQGVVVGFAQDASGVTHAVEWLPVPEPASAVLLVGGVVGLWMLRRAAV